MAKRSPFQKYSLVGAAVGAGFFVLLLATHLLYHGSLRPRLGCVIGLEQVPLNAPPELLAWIIPNEVIAPQKYGEQLPGLKGAGGMGASWSPAAFVGWGLCCYALLGAMLGAAFALLMSRIRRR